MGACKAENERKGISGRSNGMAKGSEAHHREWTITGWSPDVLLGQEGGEKFCWWTQWEVIAAFCCQYCFLVIIVFYVLFEE